MKYIIVGNGVAGTTAAAAIRKNDPAGEITIITDEAYPFYSRIRLMEFLSRDVDEQGLVIRKPAWYEDNRIALVLNTAATAIDPLKKELITSPGPALGYDRLLLAAGGISFVPPIPGADKNGVFTLRNLQDAISIRDYAESHGNDVILIGGGVLGLEAGNSLRKTGKRIAVVEFFPRLLPRQMDPEGASILQSRMEQMGFRFFLGAKSRKIIGESAAEGLILEDGTRIDGSMIIISAGVRPNMDLARRLGLACDKGVQVNDRMETSMADVYAAGDLVQHNGICYGIWPAAEKQGEVAGTVMAGGNAEYRGTTVSNTLKVAGIDLVAAGDIDAEGKKEAIVLQDRERFIYRKLVIEQGAICGAILCGDIRNRQKILRAIENRTDIGSIRKDLELGNFERL